MADLDEPLFGLPGVLDFTALLARETDMDRLQVEIQAMARCAQLAQSAQKAIEALPAVRAAIRQGALRVSVDVRLDEEFKPGGAGKRRIVDRRRK